MFSSRSIAAKIQYKHTTIYNHQSASSQKFKKIIDLPWFQKKNHFYSCCCYFKLTLTGSFQISSLQKKSCLKFFFCYNLLSCLFCFNTNGCIIFDTFLFILFRVQIDKVCCTPPMERLKATFRNKGIYILLFC